MNCRSEKLPKMNKIANISVWVISFKTYLLLHFSIFFAEIYKICWKWHLTLQLGAIFWSELQKKISQPNFGHFSNGKSFTSSLSRSRCGGENVSNLRVIDGNEVKWATLLIILHVFLLIIFSQKASFYCVTLYQVKAAIV